MLDITLTDLQFCILALVLVIAAPWVIQGVLVILTMLFCVAVCIFGAIVVAVLAVIEGCRSIYGKICRL